MDKYSYISNAHGNYIDELYKAYKENPGSVDESWQKFFEGYEFSKNSGNGTAESDPATVSINHFDKEIQVRHLIHAYRTRGHLRSNTNPVRKRKDRKPLLDLKDFGLSEADLDTEFEVGNIIVGIGRSSLRKIIATLKQIYEGTVGFEYMYIREPEILDWFKEKAENEYLSFSPSREEKKRILYKLNEAVVFENFLHTKYLGQKRFSLEGGETTIPAVQKRLAIKVTQGKLFIR